MFKNIFSLILIIALCLGCQSTKAPKLKVLAYNIHHGEGMDKKVNLLRIAKLLKESQADLIALQEVDKGCSRSHQLDIAKELAQSLGFHYEFAKFMDYDGGEYGMAVLSRFPIIQTHRHDLPAGTEPRCALEVQVHPPSLSQPLSFICIHNEWRKAPVRIKQVQTLLTSIESYTHPVILAGDFNAEPKDKSFQLFNNSHWTILDKQAAKTWPSIQPEVEIDFIITRKLPFSSYTHSVIEETQASDHRPIYANFSFSAK